MGCSAYDRFFTNLSNKVNIKIIDLLQKGPMNVREITESTGREQSAVSHSLRRLHDCNLIKVEKKGRQRIYSLNSEFVEPLFRLVDEHADTNCSRCAFSGNRI